MNPLESLMRPVAGILNRNIDNSIEAKALAEKLDGSVIEVAVRDTPLSVFFVFEDAGLRLSTEDVSDPRLKLEGSLLGFADLARGSNSAIRNGAVHISGDSDAALKFSKLLEHVKPDPEEELANVVGDAAAHRIGEVARGVLGFAKSTGETLGQNVKEYLQEESGELPTRYAVDKFKKSVNTLRDDVDRLEARIRQLEREKA